MEKEEKEEKISVDVVLPQNSNIISSNGSNGDPNQLPLTSSSEAINSSQLEALAPNATNTPEGPPYKRRRKVTKACFYCQKSHMSCDKERPCKRCISRNIGHLCKDTEAKRRGRKGNYLENPATSVPRELLPATSDVSKIEEDITQNDAIPLEILFANAEELAGYLQNYLEEEEHHDKNVNLSTNASLSDSSVDQSMDGSMDPTLKKEVNIESINEVLAMELQTTLPQTEERKDLVNISGNISSSGNLKENLAALLRSLRLPPEDSLYIRKELEAKNANLFYINVC